MAGKRGVGAERDGDGGALERLHRRNGVADVAEHRGNRAPLAKAAQAEAMLLCDPVDLHDTIACQVFAQRIIFKTAFERQGDRLRHAGIGFARRKTEIKVEIHGARHIHHSTVNH